MSAAAASAMEVVHRSVHAVPHFGIGGAMEMVIGGAVVTLILFVELPRRLGIAETVGPRAMGKAMSRTILSCWPETLGLALTSLIALLMRLRGDPNRFTDPAELRVWEEIKREWPVLMGADTLLGYQAMLRLMLCVAVVMRLQAADWKPLLAGRENQEEEIDKPDTDDMTEAGAHPGGPLAGSAGCVAAVAMATRVALCLRSNTYWLEGPLGFEWAIACEVAILALLMTVAWRGFILHPLSSTVLVLATASWASRHYLNFAGNDSIDRLFIVAHALEMVSAFAFLYNTVQVRLVQGAGEARSVATVGFVYIIMLVQQALAAYYFVEVFEPHPELVGAGRPFCVLILGNLFAFGAYVGAAAIYFASLWADKKDTLEAVEEASLTADLETPLTLQADGPLVHPVAVSGQ